MNTITYHDADGRLQEWFLYTNEASMDLSADGKLYVEGQHNGETHYVSSGTVTARPASPITLDGITLKDVPAGAVINIDGDQTVIEEADDVELVFPLSGTYQVRVEHFPYLDFVTEVTV